MKNNSVNRDALIISHIPYASRVAHDLCTSNREYNDCVGVACEALVKAIDSFDETKGAQLKSYIYMKVSYAVKDYFRYYYKTRMDTAGALDELGYMLSLPLNHDETMKQVCDKDLAAKALLSIKDPRTFNIFKRYYILSHTLLKIGEHYGITDTRVSQIINKTLKFLRKKLKREEQVLR